MLSPTYHNYDCKSTLWMGDLEAWMDEPYIRNLWYNLGEQVIVKLIRDKKTGISCGYAFVGFTSELAAQRALATIHGTRIPNTQKTFRLNWASGGGINDRKEDRAPEYSLFVGDLSAQVDETYLLSIFRRRYPSCHSAKIMTDPSSGASRGFGFVRFHDPVEQQEALVEMDGSYCGNRPLRVSLATPKTNCARYYQLALQAPALLQPSDINNTTVFVGGLSTPISEDELRRYFAPFGRIIYVKIPPGKGCGFVQYISRQAAEMAIEQMNGFQIGSSRIRLSWGRSQHDKRHSMSPSTEGTTSLWRPSPTSMTSNHSSFWKSSPQNVISSSDFKTFPFSTTTTHVWNDSIRSSYPPPPSISQTSAFPSQTYDYDWRMNDIYV
ncbi:hypothetical protein EC973_001183 [Apophysomyces ossiformis]|uniref:RRM domain-containing protein n=1 Tax=Apophysomyces ossiformis TaxID=679940 RepID=A0A8H7ENR0_9FUNG|nr:hypothetical protein EC973_001183 [Apophysomyces ossiformis]